MMTHNGSNELRHTEVGSNLATHRLDDSTTEETTDEPITKIEMREQWSRAMDFLVACIGFSVGLGNVWRFPYLCYNNGGGAFLFPYILCVLIGGLPLFYLEVALGQLMSISGVRAWNICPIFKGIAFASLVVVTIYNLYYNVVVAWTLYYMFASFASVLPWSHCDNDWNTPNCTTNFTAISTYNSSLGNFTDSVTEFWERKVLGLSDGIDEVGSLKWDVSLCLLLAWIIVYLSICKGIRTTGKIMYVTALSPYILLVAMLIRGVTLTGSLEGIIYFVKPDFDKLASLEVWVDAGTQVFYSYSIAIGSLTALGSYNQFHHNSYRDAIIFACTNSGTSLLSGFVIFSVLGHMSYERNVPMDQVAEKGPGLAFQAYPRALMEMFAAPAWSIIFFFTLILIGIDSQFVQVESVMSAIIDQWPHVLRVGYRRELVCLGLCVGMFLLGLTMCTQGGMYVFLLFDYFGGSKIILLIAFCECAAISWIYGIKRFYDDVETMLGHRIKRYMYVCWFFLSPFFCVVLFIVSTVAYSELKYEHRDIVYSYPRWAVALGWIIAFSSVIFIPVVALVQIRRHKTNGVSLIRAVKLACQPKRMTLPNSPENEIPPYMTDGTGVNTHSFLMDPSDASLGTI